MSHPPGRENPTALPSWRGLLLAVLALVGASLLAAWILSSRLERREKPAPAIAPPAPVVQAIPSAPPPPPLKPPARWQSAAGAVGDAHAISALILALDGQWGDADRHLQAMFRPQEHGDAKAARAGNETGLAHIRALEYERAVKAFQSASRADPGDVEIANNLGYSALKAGKVRDAIPLLVRSLHLAPMRSSAWINLSEALAELGHDDASLAALLLALRYSAHRDETRELLVDSTKNHPSAAFRKQATRALERIDSVPRYSRS